MAKAPSPPIPTELPIVDVVRLLHCVGDQQRVTEAVTEMPSPAAQFALLRGGLRVGVVHFMARLAERADLPAADIRRLVDEALVQMGGAEMRQRNGFLRRLVTEPVWQGEPSGPAVIAALASALGMDAVA
jgi:hypothetical protein